jgi:hypothetical protein
MPAQLSESAAIDRGGSGASPDAGSMFSKVEPIPRGPASRPCPWDKWKFYGGPPRCPSCLRSDKISICSYKTRGFGCDLLCNRCRVLWIDTDSVLCFVCGDVFLAERSRYPFERCSGKHAGICYHINPIESPFCSRCEKIIGSDRNHCRRQLRRMVGLR